MGKVDKPWADRERRTSRLIRACFEVVVARGEPTPEELLALCQLTWTTRVADGDTTRPIVAPALSILLDAELHATSVEALAVELRDVRVDRSVRVAAAGTVGLVNLYNGFRGSCAPWVADHGLEIAQMFGAIYRASSDRDAQRVFANMERMPRIPNARLAMDAANLLTPVLACLDARGRTPIINGRRTVKRRLNALALGSASLEQQCVGLQGLIGQGGIKDAFDLDACDDVNLQRVFRRPTIRKADPSTANRKPLAYRGDDDIEYLRGIDRVVMGRLHNRMTNALRTFCDSKGLVVNEGTDADCMFDALIRSYQGNERHLLVELKTEWSPPFVRMAVGQLLDYRRRLPERALMDLAALFPTRPADEAIALLEDVGACAIWFDETFESVDGVSVWATSKPSPRTGLRMARGA